MTTIETAQEQALDLSALSEKWLRACPSCDAGLPMTCTCPNQDYRPIMLQLVREVERLRALVGPCPECLDPDEDPRAWCDCNFDDPPCVVPACRQRAHPPSECPRRTVQP